MLRPTVKQPFETNTITVDNTIVSYTAKKYNKQEYVMLNIQSIYISQVTDMITDVINRTGKRITMNINDLNAYKANHIFTLDNGNKHYKWFFKHSVSIIQSDIPEYDCDNENSKENNRSFLGKFQVDSDLSLIFKRDVFFPNGESGLLPKFIPVTIKRIDFDAVTKRTLAVSSENITDKLCIDRAIRYNVLLQIKFTVTREEVKTPVKTPRLTPRKKKVPSYGPSIYTVDSIELIIDDYKETIEREFKINEALY